MGDGAAAALAAVNPKLMMLQVKGSPAMDELKAFLVFIAIVSGCFLVAAGMLTQTRIHAIDACRAMHGTPVMHGEDYVSCTVRAAK